MPADALEKLFRGFGDLAGHDGRVGAVRAVGPNHPDVSPTRIPCFAWRGTLMKAEAVRSAGLPRKDYFLYADDTEYALRMVAGGWRFFWIPGSQIVERRKEDKQRLRILGREVFVYAEAYRFYYAVRNSIHAFRTHRCQGELRTNPGLCRKDGPPAGFRPHGENGGRAKAILRGVSDGFRSKLGKRSDYHPAETAPVAEWRQAEACR